jgi:hypothetical protein
VHVVVVEAGQGVPVGRIGLALELAHGLALAAHLLLRALPGQRLEGALEGGAAAGQDPGQPPGVVLHPAASPLLEAEQRRPLGSGLDQIDHAVERQQQPPDVLRIEGGDPCLAQLADPVVQDLPGLLADAPHLDERIVEDPIVSAR